MRERHREYRVDVPSGGWYLVRLHDETPAVVGHQHGAVGLEPVDDGGCAGLTHRNDERDDDEQTERVAGGEHTPRWSRLCSRTLGSAGPDDGRPISAVAFAVVPSVAIGGVGRGLVVRCIVARSASGQPVEP